MMFDYESPKPEEPPDYTGVKIAAIVAPIFFLVTFLSNADAGLAACIVSGLILLAIKIHWNLRRHIWFWVTIAAILALHIPLIFMVRWPQGNGPTIIYTMPIGIADFLIIHGTVSVIEKFFSKNSSSDQEEN